MEEERNEELGTGDANALAALKELKENSVSKEEYNKLLAQNKELINNYINNVQQDVEEKRILLI